MFNVYKNQLSRQTGSRNLMGPKMIPTIWYTYTGVDLRKKINWPKGPVKFLNNRPLQNSTVPRNIGPI